MQIEERARPPYVDFEYRAVEDRAASIEQGHYVATDVAFAIITPHGSKDKIERVAEDWFAKLEGDVKGKRFPLEWLQALRGRFEAWKQGEEMATIGTDIRNWPALRPAELKVLQQAGVKSIEDLASATSEMISRIGMGGHGLKKRAEEWLQSANDIGKSAAQIEKLRVENEELQTSLREAKEKLAKLEASVEVLQSTAQGKKL